MKPIWTTLGTCLLAGALALGPASALADEPGPAKRGSHPVEYFFKNPQYTNVTVSPSGKYLAALAPLPDQDNSRQNIVVLSADNLQEGRFITAVDRGDVLGYTWANDDRILFTVDADGTESFGLYGVDREGGGIDELVVPQVGAGGLRSAQIMDVLKAEDDIILITYNKRLAWAPDVFKMNVNTGNTLPVARNPGNVATWIADHEGNVRAAVAVDKLKTEFRYRETGGDWQVLETYTFPFEESISPVAFAYDNKRLIVQSTVGDDTASLRYYDPKSGELGEVIYNRDDVDVGGPIMSDAREKVIGATYTSDKPHIVYFDDREQQLYSAFEQQFPDHFVGMSSWSRDEKSRIYLVSSDTDPGTYFQYVEPEDGRPEFRKLLNRMPWVEPDQMAALRPISYEARDGLTIHGYLTLPDAARHGDKPYPLIVNPHGGPYNVRDQWSFNPEHQFFADRGYAVLQVNFRGSGGYGASFVRAGYREWGGAMQNDITDGVKWAIEQGYTKQGRICIYGASYGGYATMAGLTLTPELYECGINYVGVTSIPLLFETLPKAWRLQRPMMERQIGDPGEDRERLEAASPLNYVEKIEDPVFIVHGKKDVRVDIKHAERLRDRMDELGKPYEWLVKSNEGHGFQKQENILELYGRIDDFLARHLPARQDDPETDLATRE